MYQLFHLCRGTVRVEEVRNGCDYLAVELRQFLEVGESHF